MAYTILQITLMKLSTELKFKKSILSTIFGWLILYQSCDLSYTCNVWLFHMLCILIQYDMLISSQHGAYCKYLLCLQCARNQQLDWPFRTFFSYIYLSYILQLKQLSSQCLVVMCFTVFVFFSS